jgi:uncharacterized protein (TIGR04255 family)
MKKSSKFKYPPLVEVAFEISFIAKLKVLDKISDFQDKIAKYYPNISSEELLGFKIPGPSSELMDKFRTRFIFENLDKSKMVRIALNSFNFIEKSYDSFSKLHNDIKESWDAFFSTIGDISIDRIGLRYINKLKIPVKYNIKEISDFIVPYYDKGRFNEYDINALIIDARLAGENSNLNIKSGIIGKDSDENKTYTIYLLDYDCSKLGKKLNGDPINELKNFHTAIENRFLHDIKEPYKIYMKTGKFK